MYTLENMTERNSGLCIDQRSDKVHKTAEINKVRETSRFEVKFIYSCGHTVSKFVKPNYRVHGKKAIKIDVPKEYDRVVILDHRLKIRTESEVPRHCIEPTCKCDSFQFIFEIDK